MKLKRDISEEQDETSTEIQQRFSSTGAPARRVIDGAASAYRVVPPPGHTHFRRLRRQKRPLLPSRHSSVRVRQAASPVCAHVRARHAPARAEAEEEPHSPPTPKLQQPAEGRRRSRRCRPRECHGCLRQMPARRLEGRLICAAKRWNGGTAAPNARRHAWSIRHLFRHRERSCMLAVARVQVQAYAMKERATACRVLVAATEENLQVVPETHFMPPQDRRSSPQLCMFPRPRREAAGGRQQRYARRPSSPPYVLRASETLRCVARIEAYRAPRHAVAPNSQGGEEIRHAPESERVHRARLEFRIVTMQFARRYRSAL